MTTLSNEKKSIRFKKNAFFIYFFCQTFDLVGSRSFLGLIVNIYNLFYNVNNKGWYVFCPDYLRYLHL